MDRLRCTLPETLLESLRLLARTRGPATDLDVWSATVIWGSTLIRVRQPHSHTDVRLVFSPIIDQLTINSQPTGKVEYDSPLQIYPNPQLLREPVSLYLYNNPALG